MGGVPDRIRRFVTVTLRDRVFTSRRRSARPGERRFFKRRGAFSRPRNSVLGAAHRTAGPPDSSIRIEDGDSAPSMYTMGFLREMEALGYAPPNSPGSARVAVEVGPQSVLGCPRIYVRRFKHYLKLQHRTGR